MNGLRHKACLHEWGVPSEVAEKVAQDLNGGQGGKAPPITCPGCGVAARYSAFEVIEIPDA
jgi:hypothetical protein